MDYYREIVAGRVRDPRIAGRFVRPAGEPPPGCAPALMTEVSAPAMVDQGVRFQALAERQRAERILQHLAAWDARLRVSP
jgi:hypothetical protein